MPFLRQDYLYECCGDEYITSYKIDMRLLYKIITQYQSGFGPWPHCPRSRIFMISAVHGNGKELCGCEISSSD